MTEAVKRLYRSRSEKVIAGVCGGFAKYLNVDPIIPRLVLVALFLGVGAGLLIYLICWIVIPLEPEA